MRNLLYRLLQQLHPKHTISRQQALEYFFKSPTECFTGHSHDDLCYLPEFAGLISMTDIYVRHEGHRLGYIQDICIDAENRKLYVGHLATDTDYQGIGIGRAMVFALVDFIRKDFAIDEIHFCERSEKVDIYAKFFAKLGAFATKDRFNMEKWVWKIPPTRAWDNKN
jgi:GNAT superfamily N-acetyltransferase